MPVPKLEGITCFGTRMCPWGVWVADARAETACICQFWHTDVPLGRLGGRCMCRNWRVPRCLSVPLPVIAKTGSYGRPPAWALRKAPPAAAVTGTRLYTHPNDYS